MRVAVGGNKLNDFQSLSQILVSQSAILADRTAFSYIGKPSGSIDELSFCGLRARSDALACHLRGGVGLPEGARAVLLYPQSLDFVVAFMACLRAGVVAVPLSLPINRQDQARLLAVIEDCSPDAIFTLGSIGRLPECQMLAQLRPQLPWLFTDEVFGEVDENILRLMPTHVPNDVAFLQYTSGSTGLPKGVIVSHENIVSNQRMISRAFGTDHRDIGLTWLPLYHDMGLIGFVMQSIYSGALTYMMSPLEFLQRPQIWLEAISRYRVTVSGGPNFAYELCLKRVPDDVLAGLDLSSWRVAPNGAEPVRKSTLKAFANRFAAAGFDERTHFPCYGLAEATLFVSGGPAYETFRSMRIDPVHLEGHRAVQSEQGSSVVSSGQIAEELDVRIVDVDTLLPCQPGGVGEIWVAGPSIAKGYWKKDQATVDTFQARLRGEDGVYMRTGDLGFISPEGELIITGRLKDLIIIGGKNYYPQDLEAVAERAHPSLRMGSSAAFLAGDGDEGIVMVVELRKDAFPCADLDGIKAAVRREISRQAAVRVAAIAVVAPGKVLKTTSGKIRRSDCRKEWLAGKLLDAPVESAPTDMSEARKAA